MEISATTRCRAIFPWKKSFIAFFHPVTRKTRGAFPGATAAASCGGSLTPKAASQLTQAGFLLFLIIFCGCGSPSEEKPKGLGGSMFQSTRYPVTAVLVEKDQKPVYLEALTINAAPTAEVRKRFDAVLATYQTESEDIEKRIRQCVDEIMAQQEFKRDTESRLTNEYNEKIPQAAAVPSNARNPLKSLSKARGAKDNADEWIEQQRLAQCEPIKEHISGLEARRSQLRDGLLSLRREITNRLFASLPTPTKTWKTGRNGRTTVDIPNDGPWTVWSTATHKFSTGKVRQRQGSTRSTSSGTKYTETEVEKDTTAERSVRWILDIPTDIDENDTLSLDLSNVLDQRTLNPAAAGTEAPYFNTRR